MKKIIIKVLSFILSLISVCFIFTGCKIESDKNSTFTLKTYDTKRCKNCSIKYASQSKYSSASYLITPSGFDYDELNINGYYMTITISYSVYYKKDSLLPDIMYAGAPEYDLSILSSDVVAFGKSDLKPTKTSTAKSYSYNFDIVNLKDTKMVLTFSTINVQNVIYFTNIVVSYNCYKYN